MAQTATPKLDAGALFPAMTLDLIGGGLLELPTQDWTALLLYRGHW